MEKKQLKSGRVMRYHYPPGFYESVLVFLGGAATGAEQVFDAVCKHAELFGEKSRASIARDYRIFRDLTDDELADFFASEILEDPKMLNGRLVAKIRKIEKETLAAVPTEKSPERTIIFSNSKKRGARK